MRYGTLVPPIVSCMPHYLWQITQLVLDENVVVGILSRLHVPVKPASHATPFLATSCRRCKPGTWCTLRCTRSRKFNAKSIAARDIAILLVWHNGSGVKCNNYL